MAMIKENIIELEKKWAELLKECKRTSVPKMSNTKITATELQIQLLQDKEYQKRLKEKEKVRIALEAAYAEDEKPLVKDLLKVGLNITSSWDLVNTRDKYPNAIPVLINHLNKDYHEKNKEGIVRALAVKEAIGKASPALIAEYNRTSKDKESLRWAIGNTIYTTITNDDIESILSIVQDKTNGMSRQMFVVALGKVKSEKTENALINLLDDEEITSYVLVALGKMKSKKAKEKISMLTNHPQLLIKIEAQKALKRIL